MKIINKAGRRVSWDFFWQKAEEDRLQQIAAAKVPDMGLIEWDRILRDQLDKEDCFSPRKKRIKTLILADAKVRGTTSDRIRKSNRRINEKKMRQVIDRVTKAGNIVYPVNETWLSEGAVGTGTPEEFGQSQCAAVNGSGDIKTFFPLRGLVSRLKTHHFNPSMGTKWCVYVIDQDESFITPSGEILAAPSVANAKCTIYRNVEGDNIPLKVKFRSGRIVSQCGLKGVTVPTHGLGYVRVGDNFIKVDIIAGPNSIKGGLTTAKVGGFQLKNWREFNIVTDELPGRFVTGTYEGKQVKVGLAKIHFTELAREFSGTGFHPIGTEVIRLMELAGNSAFVDHMEEGTNDYADIFYRQMLGELKLEGYAAYVRPKYSKDRPWDLRSLISSWDRVPLPDDPSEFAGRLIPSKEMVKRLSIETDSGWLIPTWAAALNGALVNHMCGRGFRTGRLDAALKQQLAGSRGATRMSARPKLPCLQGKQVGCWEVSRNRMATTATRFHSSRAIVVRYPQLWAHWSKVIVEPVPDTYNRFMIDHANCRGLIFRNPDDMLWEQSDADGDVSFAYVVPGIVWAKTKVVVTDIAEQGKIDYTDGEVGAVLKDRPVHVIPYLDVVEELITASQNKSLMGTATIDLWKLIDGLWGAHRERGHDCLEVIDAASFWIQDVVVRGIKHNLSGVYSPESLASYLCDRYPEFADTINAAFAVPLQEALLEMGNKYATRATIIDNFSQTQWTASWLRRTWDKMKDKLSIEDLLAAELTL